MVCKNELKINYFMESAIKIKEFPSQKNKNRLFLITVAKKISWKFSGNFNRLSLQYLMVKYDPC